MENNNIKQLLQLDLVYDLMRPSPIPVLTRLYPAHLFLIGPNRCSIMLSHDIDFYLHQKAPTSTKLRFWVSRILSRTPLGHHLDFINDNYRELLFELVDLERAYGFRSTLFLRQSEDVHLLFAKSIIRELPQGFEIGLHNEPSATISSERLALEKRKLEVSVRKKITSCRTHNLLFPSFNFVRSLENHGIILDSTLGYNNAIGFRGGISTAFKPYKGRVIEVPLAIMDIVLFRDLNLSLKKVLKLLERIFDRVAKEKCSFSVNWHVDYMNVYEFKRAYSAILDILANEDIAIFTPSQAIHMFREAQKEG